MFQWGERSAQSSEMRLKNEEQLMTVPREVESRGDGGHEEGG